MQRSAALFAVFVGGATAIGVATHHYALWVAIGVALGAVVSRIARGKEASGS